MALVFYDFEVFKYDWLVVLHEYPGDKRTHICNSKEELQTFYDAHKNDIWIGFNSRKYDQWILRAILGGFNPYDMNEWLISKGKDGYLFNRELNNIKLYNYDVYKGITDYSLKTLEGFMGDNIKETSVDFKLDRKLTQKEITETYKYCDYDVDKLIKVFTLRKDEFDTHINMIKEFKLSLDCINKTTAQLLAIILGASKTTFNDEFDLRVPPTLELNKYAFVKDWFLNSYEDAKKELNEEYINACEVIKYAYKFGKKKVKDAQELVNDYKYNYDELFKKYFYNRSLKIDVAGIEHIFAWGGVHGAEKMNYVCRDDEVIIMADATSLYPSIDIVYDLQSRAIKDKSIYVGIYSTNIEMKKNKNPKRPIYKLACNISYGCKGDKYNALYDKRNQNLTCVYGQLLILDLIEKIEPYIVKFIQSNTDGIAFVIKKKDFKLFDDLVYDFEKRTRLNMEFTLATKMFQKDVNNYVMVLEGDKFKSKGGYVKELSLLDNDLPIVNEAIKNYLVKGISIEDTINGCNELIRFQKIVKLSSKYEYVMHNYKKYSWKSYRVFASKNIFEDGTIYKCKGESKCDKFANTPDNCFIDNGKVEGVKVPSKLDKQYYINLAKKRLSEGFNYNLCN